MTATDHSDFVPFPRRWLERSLHEIVIEQAGQRADRLAIIDPDRAMTYAELLDASAWIAKRIAAEAVGASPRIALLFDQDALFNASVLSVLRIGGAYVPLDSRRGTEWNATVVKTAECGLVLYGESHLALADSLGLPRICVRAEDWKGVAAGTCIARDPDSLACIYFTSGTTGEPKGVCDTHRNLLHNTLRYTNTLRIDTSDKLSLIQAPVFSGTQSTMFMGMIDGATLFCFDVSKYGLQGLPEWIQDTGVTVFHAVPAIFRMLARENTLYDDVRLVRLEGDRATQQDEQILRAHFTDECVLVNGLGATECGLVRQYFIGKDAAAVSGDLPLGYAVPDVDVSIVDERGVALPTGDTGEVLIHSRYLATGYLNQPELTKEKFITDEHGRRSYMSGDLGHLDSAGCLRLNGRKDHWIKIKGETVCTAAVESALTDLPDVRQAIVAQRIDQNDNAYLAAWLVPTTSTTPRVESIWQDLAGRVPGHWRPKRVVWLEELPVSIDGKLDYGALPELANIRPELDTPYVSPRNPVEQKLVTIWQDVLAIAPIGVFDDLTQLGCDSLAAVRAFARIETELETQLSVASLFEDATVEGLAIAIDEEKNN